MDCDSVCVFAESRIWCKKASFFTPNESKINGVKKRLYFHHLLVLDIRGAKSPWHVCRSKGMAIRGLVSGRGPRSGKDERQRTFRRTRDRGGDNYHVDNLCARFVHDYFLVLAISSFDVPTVVAHSDGLRNPARNGFTSIRFLPANCKSVKERR